MSERHTKRLIKYRIARECDVSRFMALEHNVCRLGSWLESFGSVTLGSEVVPTLKHPGGQGLRGDLEALGGDYRRVGAHIIAEKKKALAASS